MAENGDGLQNPSHSVNTKSENEHALSRADVMALIRQKDEIETKITELEESLQSQSQVGMNGSLLDADGYPRSDIDVYSVRHARHDIICLNNDHSALMKRIEEGLYALHAQARNQGSVVADKDTAGSSPTQPFAKISFISPESPAANSGFEVGDLITAFGSANSRNFRSLRDLATVVTNSENRVVTVEVLRQGVKKRLCLTPKRWAGQGLLGCSFVEEKTTESY